MKTFDDIRETLSSVTHYIVEVETEMSCVWFDVDGSDGIYWGIAPNGKRRLMVAVTMGDGSTEHKPLVEAKTDIRINSIKIVNDLRAKALIQSRARLIDIKDVIGDGNNK